MASAEKVFNSHPLEGATLQNDSSLITTATPSIFPFYARRECFSCHFNLEEFITEWWNCTGCPACNRSFVD